MSMCVEGTPLEPYPDLGLWVKREDRCCPGGPNFSKARGVFAHVRARNEGVVGVLDTSHSQGGWAVARACQLLGKQCRVFYPEFKDGRGPSQSQKEAYRLGAGLYGLKAGRSAVLYHQAKKALGDNLHLGSEPTSTYMMPNALKLPESVEETALEVGRTEPLDARHVYLVSASSGTIAAGLIQGLWMRSWWSMVRIIVHLGYSRPEGAVREYLAKMSGIHVNHLANHVHIVDEGYSYADRARPGPVPPFTCNEFYDLKAFRWWVREGRDQYNKALLWNIG